MADAVISGLVGELSRRLTDAAIEEYGLLRSFKDDLLIVREDLSDIQAVLEDAEKKHTKDKVVELWLKKLRSVSLKMEDVLDEVSTEAMLQNLYKERGFKYRVRSFLSSDHNQLMFRTRIAHKVKALRKKLADISAKRLALNLSPGVIINPIDAGIPNRETSSFIHSSTVFGRNEEIEKITEMICNPDTCKNKETGTTRVYAIWGMGGLGKTTVAQLVYNHKRVKEHFNLKCWIYVSENFQVKELIKGIIESINKDETVPSQLDEMQKCLQEKLRGKKFLIVLDDVWAEQNEKSKWDQLSETLSCGAEGSIVMVTTRSMTTSQMTAKLPKLQHELGCLSEEDSWSLFKKLAFAEGTMGGDIRDQLEPIGRKIVEKCKGLPLAVKTLGSLMWSKSSTSEWERVMISDIWNLQESNVLPALKLSYNNLPPHVKQCFAYCCMLPKGHKMGKDLLIFLWMANRLIPSSEEADWYVTGEEIFNSLIWRSFIQVVDEEYKMHDLMHDLASDVMGFACSIIEPGKELKVPDEVLHLSSSSPDFASLQHDLEKFKSLRSIFIFSYLYESSISRILDHVYLRVLYLDRTGLDTLSESISKLKHLRYLNLSNTFISVLPESIIYLQNLQVLLLNGCRKLNKMPEGMRYMRNLQYLETDGCDSLSSFPVGIGKLTSLRRLTYFPISKNYGAQIGELGYLNLIGPNLKLGSLENVGGLKDAQNANLKSKTHMLLLCLSFGPTNPWGYKDSRVDNEVSWTHEEKVIEGLEPNPGLKELVIHKSFARNISPSWVVNLRCLVEICFCDCEKCEYITPLGKLPSLRVIRLESMKSLKCFHDDDMTTTSGDNILFPQLEKLIIRYAPQLINMPGNFPKLKVLHLHACHNLVSLPEESFKNLNTLYISSSDNLRRRYAEDIGVDWPKISHIPNIKFYPWE